MRRAARLTVMLPMMLVVLMGLGACQQAPGAIGKGGPAPNAITGGAIEVTALDGGATPATSPPTVPGVAPMPAAPDGAKPDPVKPDPARTGTADTDIAVPDQSLSDPAKSEPAKSDPEKPEAKPDAGKPDAATGQTAKADAKPAPPPKSAQQRACERKGGGWALAGKSGASTCITPTGEGTKQCTRETDCKGSCLARSGTCAPYTPLFGCNEILQADGSRVTLCID